MKNSYRIELLVRNRRVESLRLSERENKIFTELLDEKIENLNVEFSFSKKNSAIFTSTNDKTIEENLKAYFSKSYVEDLNLNDLIREALKDIELVA